MPHLNATLSRIQAALRRAGKALEAFTAGAIDSVLKEGGDPVTAAGRAVFGLDGKPVQFNQPDPLLPGFVATAPGIEAQVRELLGI